MIILSIDTSCDETSVAITDGRKVLANSIYSQVLIHKKWGGVVPSLAKRAHEERIDYIIIDALIKFSRILPRLSFPPGFTPFHAVGNLSDRVTQENLINIMKLINYIAVTYGPGLAIALEVGINKAKELAKKYNKKLIAVNHMEGHIYSSFVQNSRGNPKNEFKFPYLCLLVSGGHTELVIFKDHLKYEVIGTTLDDAAGEALDKAAKLLGLGYPGGPVIEILAKKVDNQDFHQFPRPMLKFGNFNFSFSGLKTSFYYYLKNLLEKDKISNLEKLASSFQEAVFDTVIKKTEMAIKKTGISNLVVGGGVIANMRLRKLIRDLAKKHKGSVLFPPYKYLTGDNAAMIGVVANYKLQQNQFVNNLDSLDRVPRLSL